VTVTTAPALPTVGAHRDLANFKLVWESLRHPSRMRVNISCADFEAGFDQVTTLEPDMISFWPEKTASKPGACLEDLSAFVEESRTETESSHCKR
jgi:hypothetical protein